MRAELSSTIRSGERRRDDDEGVGGGQDQTRGNKTGVFLCMTFRREGEAGRVSKPGRGRDYVSSKSGSFVVSSLATPARAISWSEFTGSPNSETLRRPDTRNSMI